MLLKNAVSCIVLAASASLIKDVSGQKPVNTFLRPENIGVSKNYDFDNMDKHTGHLVEKPPAKPDLPNPADYVDVEAYDAALMQQLGSESLIAKQFTQFEHKVDDTTLICEGEVTMIQLYCPADACDGENLESCEGCKAHFCMIDFDLQKENPEKYLSIMDLIGESRHCDSELIVKDFVDVVQECRDYDREKDATGYANVLPKNLPLAGLITEIGYTDSEFVSSSIVSADPTTRVVVEPQPVTEAMTVCDSYLKNRRKKLTGNTDTCNRDKAAKLVKDVVYMLSRTRDISEEQVIIKAESDAVQGIDIFDLAFPDVNWMFIYNDGEAEIGAQMATSRPERANCVKTKIDPQPALLQVLEESGLNVEDLSLAQYCAAFFSMLAKKAIDERSKLDKGTFVYSENALDAIPKVFLNDFHTPDPDGIKATKFAEKKARVTGIQHQSHMKKVNLATKEETEDAESVYGHMFSKLEELQGIEPNFR